MLFSIIIPIYNAEKYIRECLDSCCLQDFPRDQYEIICVNDGSKDSSLSVLQEYISKYKITVINKENEGVSSARNVGIKHAKGKFLWFVDADDIITKDALVYISKKIKDKECDIFKFGFYVFSDMLSKNEYEQYSTNNLSSNCSIDNGYSWNKIFRKSFLEKNELIFNEGLDFSEDGVFLSECYHNKPIEKSDTHVLYLYRKHPYSQTSSKGALKKKIQGHSRAAIIYYGFYKNWDDNKKGMASNVMYNLCMALYEIAWLEHPEEISHIKYLHDNGLYPIKKLKECRENDCPFVRNNGFSSKVVSFIYSHNYKVVGYYTMRLLLHTHLGAVIMNNCWKDK